MSEKPIQSTHSRKSKGRDYWARHVKAYEASGLSKAEYARRHDLAPNTLYNWKLKLSRESMSAQKTSFVPVQVEQACEYLPLQREPIQITLPNGLKLAVPVSASPETVLPWIDQLSKIHA